MMAAVIFFIVLSVLAAILFIMILVGSRRVRSEEEKALEDAEESKYIQEYLEKKKKG